MYSKPKTKKGSIAKSNNQKLNKYDDEITKLIGIHYHNEFLCKRLDMLEEWINTGQVFLPEIFELMSKYHDNNSFGSVENFKSLVQKTIDCLDQYFTLKIKIRKYIEDVEGKNVCEITNIRDDLRTMLNSYKTSKEEKKRINQLNNECEKFCKPFFTVPTAVKMMEWILVCMVIILLIASYVLSSVFEMDVYEIVYVKYAVEVICSLIPLAASAWMIYRINRCMHNGIDTRAALVKIIPLVISGMLTMVYVVNSVMKRYVFDVSSVMIMFGMALMSVVMMRYIVNEKLSIVDWIVNVVALTLAISSQIDRIVHAEDNGVINEKLMKMVIVIVAMLVLLWNLLLKKVIMGDNFNRKKNLNMNDRDEPKRRESLMKSLLNYLLVVMMAAMIVIETGNDFVAAQIRKYMNATNVNDVSVV
ncbi:hypothetical protein M896_140040 [Ordospora colligata OC4]|uniref:Uncharacterized protein n=1 Tax=Ordospora colligata OC4 TaxID=1354746 RepID=A0A0B2UIK1_9MICR|nr:uncharacterized protein M896_140040 [Ordospora colligata OC4]KHN68780.1 hypothetical protein M896_140040 [Ordospora colligata OC4]TBU13778.1 hypothetical protein CWI40_140040 [Ordospora colligata]